LEVLRRGEGAEKVRRHGDTEKAQKCGGAGVRRRRGPEKVQVQIFIISQSMDEGN
jgi:hypothetical protein